MPLPVTLKVDIKNTKACIFYEKLGWKKISTHKSTPSYHLYSYNFNEDNSADSL